MVRKRTVDTAGMRKQVRDWTHDAEDRQGMRYGRMGDDPSFAPGDEEAVELGIATTPTPFGRLMEWVHELDGDRLDDRPELENLRIALGDGGSSSDIMLPPILHRGGLDWLEITVYGGISPSGLEVFETLERAKTKAQSMGVAKWATSLNAEQVLVWRQGAGTGFSHHPYVVEWQGIKIRLGARPSSFVKADSVQPLLFVDVTGAAFLHHGDVRVMRNIDKFLSMLGVTVVKERVRRVDGCVDVVGHNIREFVEHIERGEWVSRSQQVQVHYSGNRLTGVTIKGTQVLLRIYDKIEQTKDKPEDRAAMVTHRWGGIVPDHATRVEFQLRPGKAEWAEIGSMAELLPSLNVVFQRCSTAWFRIAKVKSRSHTERSKILPVWQQVVDSFALWTHGCVKYPGPKVKQPADMSRLMKACHGIAALISVAAGIDLSDRETAINFWNIIAGVNGIADPVEDIRDRMTRILPGRPT